MGSFDCSLSYNAAIQQQVKLTTTMGYTTTFKGEFTLTPPATAEQVAYINLFSSTRRVKRDPFKLATMYNGAHGLNGQYGVEGEYFCKDDGNFGQNNDASVTDNNWPPAHQPGLWCQWVLSDDGKTLQWDGGEKFYHYEEWLEYMIIHFFVKWGIHLNGVITWQGEDIDDRGTIKLTDSVRDIILSDEDKIRNAAIDEMVSMLNGMKK